jgi:MoxR-like ATPase
VLIEGKPGIGKTTLLRQLIAIAEERVYAILSCRPTRSETDLSYVGLVELPSAVDGGVVDALPAPQARVLRMILRRDECDRDASARTTSGSISRPPTSHATITHIG